MKKLTLFAAGLGLLAAALPTTAQAQPWQSVNQRQDNLYNRIDQGVRSGALNRPEARRLRAQFVGLNRLEADYRRSRPGLTLAERRDLDRRFDALSQRIRLQKHDRQRRGY